MMWTGQGRRQIIYKQDIAAPPTQFSIDIFWQRFSCGLII